MTPPPLGRLLIALGPMLLLGTLFSVLDVHVTSVEFWALSIPVAALIMWWVTEDM